MTWVTVSTAHETEWNKTAAVRAASAARVQELVQRLLHDLSKLSARDEPSLDYLGPEALDTIRSSPDPFQVVGRLAGGGDRPAASFRTTTYWPESDNEPVDVELDIRGQGLAFGHDVVPVPLTRSRRRLTATVDPVLDRIAKVQLS